jgi:TPR repeat protein
MLLALSLVACGGMQARAQYDAQACVERALRHGVDAATSEMARAEFKEECSKGDAVACSQLGVMYEKGLAVPASAERARDLYSYACDQGNTSACVNYAKLLAAGHTLAATSSGSRVSSTRDHVSRLLSAACRKGDPRACGELGSHYLLRMGDVASSTPLLRGACDRGHADSCFLLATQYDHGALGDDALAASRYYEKSCAKGHEKGCLHFDLIYAKLAHRRSGLRLAIPSSTRCKAGQSCPERMAQLPRAAGRATP